VKLWNWENTEMVNFVYRIQLVESERGWGQDYWHEDYKTYDEAKARIQEVNSRNKPGPAPDYYVQADNDIRCVEV
jgi:hypothetical protein